jgi:hypothetical protein
MVKPAMLDKELHEPYEVDPWYETKIPMCSPEAMLRLQLVQPVDRWISFQLVHPPDVAHPQLSFETLMETPEVPAA